MAAAIKSAQDSEHYRLTIKPDGTFQLQAEAVPNHVDAMDAVSEIRSMLAGRYIPKIMRETRPAVPVATTPASNIPTCLIGKVVAQWLTRSGDPQRG